MKPLLIIWIGTFVLTFVLVSFFFNKGVKKVIGTESEKKEWKLMGGRTNYYRLVVVLCFFLSVVVTYLIKFLFGL